MTSARYQLLPYPEKRGQDIRLLHDELLDIVAGFVTGQERSQQTRIGPSEVGIPCDRCLGHKLAGVGEAREVAWLPFVGTCVHEKLANEFTVLNYHDTTGLLRGEHHAPRWLVEQQVSVGEIDGVDITGHADLFDRATASVIDWKVVGATTLKKAKRGPSETYRRQLHLYGRGFTRRGLDVDRVVIMYLPRNAMTLREAIPWSEPYDEQVAVDALARADTLARAIRIAGWDNVRPGLAADPDCPNCHRYPLPDGSTLPRPGRRADTFSDVLGVSA